jgi:hypothetical protein
VRRPSGGRAALASAIAGVVPDAPDAGLRADAVLGELLFQSLITGEDLDLDRTPEQLLAFVSSAAGMSRPTGGGAGSAS